MFRTLLRSASDPILREHVCFSCLAGVRAQTRLFSRTSLSRLDSVETQSSQPNEKRSRGKARPNKHTRDASKPKTRRNKRTRAASRGKTHSRSKANSAKSIEDTFLTLTETLIAQSTLRGKSKFAEKATPLREHQPKLVSTVNEIVSQLDGGEKPGENAMAKTFTFPEPPTLVRKAIVSRIREVTSVKSKKTGFKEVRPKIHQQVPQLSYGLERVLFNPGVYQLRDPRTRVHNFDPYLGSIMPVTEFDFAALKDYITSSSDSTLRDIAIQHKRKYIGSTSSMTSVLSHFHYLLSAWRPINTSAVSRGFTPAALNYTQVMRAPAAIFLRYDDGVYAIDADKEYDSANVLMSLGKSMEKLLTVPKEHFERYRRSHQNKITAAEEQLTPESYHYSTLGDFMMRSQLDAYDPRLPGTGMFDLKTRAVVSIRQNADEFEEGLGYQIKSRFGDFESYEREYYDMIRSAFLKYSLQVRMGRMDGIFVAYHNIQQIFGFQYISLSEMDQALHGQWDTTLGDAEFRLSLQLWNKVLNKATAKFPKRSLRFHIETRPTDTPYMYIFYEPVTGEEIEAIQNKNKAEIDAIERRILNLESTEDEPEESAATTASDDQAREHLAPEDTSPEQLSEEEQEGKEAEALGEAAAAPGSSQPRELGAMTLTIANRVNDNPVPRPENLNPHDNWTVEFEICELEGHQVVRYYDMCLKRRAIVHGQNDKAWRESSSFHQTLKDLTQRGRALRKTQERQDKELGMLVLDGVKV
ncbi:mitochondrial protein Pet127-domain-containing protein [Aspergillus carlsbadensis]|nr:mitochondrial protein Pet127-domain-containing protein [Aspergillus carlsbadensis]